MSNPLAIIAGLGTKESSPIAQLVQPLGGELWSWKDVEENLDEFTSRFTVTDDLIDILGHSLGGYCAVLLASALISKCPRIRLTLLDPVTGDVQHPWAQIGAGPLSLSPNVISAWDYLRMGVFIFPPTWPCFPPYHQPLAFHDGGRFQNIQIPDSDHNSLVAKMADRVIQRVKGTL